MLRKSHLLLFAAIIILLGNSAFVVRPALQSQTSPQGSWYWLFIVILIMFGVSLLLILRSNATLGAVAEYGLDQHGHAHGDDHSSAVITSAEHGDIMVEPELAVETSPAAFDDLTIIEGIGPKISGLLNGAGINTFQDLAAADQETLENILKSGGSAFGMAHPESWPEQASLAAAGKWDEQKDLSDRLRGGR